MSHFAARFRLKLKYSSRVRQAAEQMWSNVQQGLAFEIPASLSTDDATTKALLCLQEMHPDCPVSMLQSRSIIVGHVKTAQGVSKEAWAVLDRADYFPSAQKARSSEAFLAQQEQFMRRTLTGLSGGREEYGVDALVAKAQAEQAARDAMVLSNASAESTVPMGVDPIAEAQVAAMLADEKPSPEP